MNEAEAQVIVRNGNIYRLKAVDPNFMAGFRFACLDCPWELKTESWRYWCVCPLGRCVVLDEAERVLKEAREVTRNA